MKDNRFESRSTSGRKALVLGGTGAMGAYLVPDLARRGFEVQVVSLDAAISDDPRISYAKGDAKDPAYLKELLGRHFDVIVDFMISTTREFEEKHELLLGSTEHYIFLSTYRVYSGESPITEKTPRLLEASTDAAFLATEDYALFKARQEDILKRSKRANWTIVRPAITYSKRRFQLVTLEAPVVVSRARRGLPVVLPREALSVEATMTWAGDVAEMIARLLLNPSAFRECFTVATAEHRTWGEIAAYYRDLIGLQYVAADTEDYVEILGGSAGSRYQLAYDRLYPRRIDNSKILAVTGLKQAELMPLRRGLEKELSALPKDAPWPDEAAVLGRMDAYLKGPKAGAVQS